MFFLLLVIHLVTVSSVLSTSQRHGKLWQRIKARSSQYSQAELSMGHAIAHELDNLLMAGYIPTPAPGMTFAPRTFPTQIPGIITFAPWLMPTSHAFLGSVTSGKMPTPAPGNWNPQMTLPTASLSGGSGNGCPKSAKFLDLVIVLDSSGSVGSYHFNEAKTAAKTIVKYINMRAPISTTGSRVSLIEFSSSGLTNVAFHLGDYNILWDDLDAVDRVSYDSGPRTATARALHEAKREFDRNGIPTNAKLVWVITDGMSNEGGNPLAAANLLKDAGIKVCATGVGDSGNINHAEIDGIASQNCAFYPTSFSTYVKAVEAAYAKGSAICTDYLDKINFGK